MNPIVSIENISKKFDKNYVLNGVTINIPKGSICGLVGPNGVQGKLPIKLTDEEVDKLRASADALKDVISQITL